MTNVLLVQVVDNYGPNKFLPLSIGYQWLTAVKDPNVKRSCYLLDVLIEKIVPEQYIDSLSDAPDVAAMSCYVWNWEYNKSLARSIKRRWPRCKIVVGGPQIPKHDPMLLEKEDWIDVAVLGENEMVLKEFLSDLDLYRIGQYSGVITKHTKEIKQPDRTQLLDEIPSPILSGFYDSIMSKYPDDIMWQVTWETMRGCPYHCSFCDIGDDYWNKTKWFDLDRLKKEIQWMSDHKIEYVSVCDSNWGIHPRDVEITQWIIDAKRLTGFPRIIDVTWAKNSPSRVQEIVMMDHHAGSGLFRGVNFSMQSLNPETLRISKRFNLQDDVTRKNIQYYRNNNIATYTELIWPMPGESLQSFTTGLQSLIDLGQKDFLTIHPLVLTPNSPMGQPEYIEKNQIEFQRVPLDTFWLNLEDPKNYIIEYVDAVKGTSAATYEDMIEGYMVSHWLIVLYHYGWAHYVMKYLRKQHGIKELDFVHAWLDFLKNNDTTWISAEHNETLKSIRNVFEHGDFWGRPLEVSGSIRWEYKSASSVVLHQNRHSWWEVLHEFVVTKYDIDPIEVIKINDAMCVDWKKQYPFVLESSEQLIKNTLGIPSTKVLVDHHDIVNVQNENLFISKAYHWRRRICYWRCFAQPCV